MEEGHAEGEGKKSRKEGRTERSEENQRRIGNGKKEVIDWVRSWFGECNNQTDRFNKTYILLSVMVKSERQKKGANKRETYRHCWNSTTILSTTKMTHLPCTNQPYCGSNVSSEVNRRG